MYRSRTDRVARLVAAAAMTVVLGTALAGCSNPGLYLDRRDAIALGGGDSIAANEVTQMVDPWPAYSGNKNIAFNGEKMQAAVQRYRIGKVTPPEDPMSLQTTNQAGQSIQTTVNTGGAPAAAMTSTATQ